MYPEVKGICLGETSTFLCDKILTLDLPFFHKHYKTWGKKKAYETTTFMHWRGKKTKQEAYIYIP